MSWQEALEEIESLGFDARLNVVSDMGAFFRAADKEPAVLELSTSMLESGDVREIVLGRIHDLSRLEVDRRYENPNDSALAVLLWLTTFSAPDYTQIAADLVDRVPQCWYAKKFARRILIPPPVATGNYLSGESPVGPRGTGAFSGDLEVTMNPITKDTKKMLQGKAGVSATTAR